MDRTIHIGAATKFNNGPYNPYRKCNGVNDRPYDPYDIGAVTGSMIDPMVHIGNATGSKMERMVHMIYSGLILGHSAPVSIL